ncbi:SAM-dependent methyltransferase [Mycobacterium sp. CPCC 205710]|uniref:S-adenosyl-L-methionine-dependent methyltransferase n=1 Tax=Mycobacterium deserti TaxID=2978347 RepID=A0ABT2M9N8_9MYCO|nr:SAM-dependent methyltransferase [Mycobacterium deserti]MCT7658984.1 SAM-dependent methyltransferase [Mycobacterium deserti]
MQRSRPVIATSLGSAVVRRAAARATESERHDPLSSDPMAALLISPPEITKAVETSAEINSRVPALAAAHRQAIDYEAARTRYFDAYFAEAAEAGIRQVVIVAAGLDSRAFRLAWPDGTTVFELDRPEILNYKAVMLGNQDIRPRVHWRPVGVERDGDWPRMLFGAGFNHNEPTAWLAEGLLPLPAAAQDALITDIDGLSAAGSRFALDEAFGYVSGYHHPADWLTSRGWWTTTFDVSDYLEQLSRLAADHDDPLFSLRATFVTAEKVA